MTAGMGVGAFACFLSRQLLLEPTYLLGSFDTFQATFGQDLPALYEVTGTPKMLAYVGYFGALFALPRWWMNADPLRNGRFGLIATAMTVVVAIILNAVMPIPRGFMVAATMVIAVQLASPWIDHRARREVKEQLLAHQDVHVA